MSHLPYLLEREIILISVTQRKPETPLRRILHGLALTFQGHVCRSVTEELRRNGTVG